MTLRRLVEAEARAARLAAPGLEDDAVTDALVTAGHLVRENATAILAANGDDVRAARTALDAGTLDRLRLDETRLEGLAAEVSATASLDPLPREAETWTL